MTISDKNSDNSVRVIIMKYTSICLLTLIINVTFLATVAPTSKLRERFAWKQLDFEWPSDDIRAESVRSGRYVQENNLPLGVEHYNGKIFVTVPRWKNGVLSSLNYVDLNGTEKSPKLRPYPDWKTATSIPEPPYGNGDGPADGATVVSTFRVQADACDRLWVADTGVGDILGNTSQITPNAIVIFDLKTDKLLHRYTIPTSQLGPGAFLGNIVVDVDASDCDNAYAYVMDIGSYAIISYSLAKDRSHRISHHYFSFDPLGGEFHVDGNDFQWKDGIFGATLGPKKEDNSRDLYFHPFCSTKEFKVSNRVLQNETLSTSEQAFHEYEVVGDRGNNSQSTTEAYDKDTDVIFYTQINKDSVACWNVNKPYNSETQGLVDSDSNAMIFPNDLKLDPAGDLWVLTDRLPTFMYKQLDPNEYNFRIFTGKNRDLIKGTVCDNSRQ